MVCTRAGIPGVRRLEGRRSERIPAAARVRVSRATGACHARPVVPPSVYLGAAAAAAHHWPGCVPPAHQRGSAVMVQGGHLPPGHPSAQTAGGEHVLRLGGSWLVGGSNTGHRLSHAQLVAGVPRPPLCSPSRVSGPGYRVLGNRRALNQGWPSLLPSAASAITCGTRRDLCLRFRCGWGCGGGGFLGRYRQRMRAARGARGSQNFASTPVTRSSPRHPGRPASSAPSRATTPESRPG